MSAVIVFQQRVRDTRLVVSFHPRKHGLWRLIGLPFSRANSRCDFFAARS
jgi:hypothetical protein